MNREEKIAAAFRTLEKYGLYMTDEQVRIRDEAKAYVAGINPIVLDLTPTR